MVNCISFHKVKKWYGKHQILHDVSFDVKQGSITGLVGSNGAGKSTIFKVLSGIVDYSDGTIELFGEPQNLKDARREMSFMIESPYLDFDLSGEDNVKMICYIRGLQITKEEMDKIFIDVGLQEARKKKAGKYSLGMKQRLGLAMSLVSKPKCIVLDEPVNGLDPEGMVDIRNMLLKINEESGITILVSSHLLNELDKMATDYIFIRDGRILEQISEKELLEKCHQRLVLDTDNNERTVKLLEQYTKWTIEMSSHDGIFIHNSLNNEDRKMLNKLLYENNILITKIDNIGENLEEYYIRRIEGENEKFD